MLRSIDTTIDLRSTLLCQDLEVEKPTTHTSSGLLKVPSLGRNKSNRLLPSSVYTRGFSIRIIHNHKRFGMRKFLGIY